MTGYIGVQPVPNATRYLQENVLTVETSSIQVTGGYSVGNINLYINGQLIPRSEYTATNGTSVDFSSPLPVGTAYSIEQFRTFEVADLDVPVRDIVNALSGIGGDAILSNDWDSITTSGFYYNNDSAAVGIPASYSDVMMIHVDSPNGCSQIAYRNSSTNYIWRRNGNGPSGSRTWNSWVRVHEGSFTISLSGDLSGSLTIDGDNSSHSVAVVSDSHTHSSSTITSISNAVARTAIASSAINAVGTYALLCRSTLNSSIYNGSTYAGSSLRFAGFLMRDSNTSSGYYVRPSGTPSGTWRAMGQAITLSDSGDWYRATLFLRIS